MHIHFISILDLFYGMDWSCDFCASAETRINTGFSRLFSFVTPFVTPSEIL